MEAPTNKDKSNSIKFYCGDMTTNRKDLFKEALSYARHGKVLYIAIEAFSELPELSQDITTVDRKSMKMISFLYANTLVSLLESISTLPEWQNIPCAIILENLPHYCQKENLQNSCGVVAYLIDSAYNCSIASGLDCKLIVSINQETGFEYCSILKELYSK